MNRNEQLLSAALKYASLGYPVFPCRGKIPLLHNGFKGASTDPDIIHHWWAETGDYPGANIGLATGHKGLFVLDVDKKAVSEEDFRELYEISTSTVFTPGGGYHKYLETPIAIRNTVGLRPGVDIRGEGGYVIAAPSEGYMVDEEFRDLAAYGPCPASSPLLQELFNHSKVPPSPVPNNHENFIVTGGRNDYLTRVAGAMQRKGLDPEAIEAALQVENENKCVPPLSDREVTRIVASVSRYAPGDPITASLGASGPASPINANKFTVVQEEDCGILVRADTLVQASIDYLSNKDLVKGTPTLIEGLDRMLGGGKRLGEVTCWHAEAKTGKNTLWHYLMYLWLEMGIPLAYASRELSPEEEVIPNLMAIAYEENAWLLDMNEERAAKYQEKLAKWPLYFSKGYGHFPAQDIQRWLMSGVEAGIQYFWFDHLHYMLEDPEDHKAASKLIKDIKSIAKTLKIHVDIIIQPNKMQDGQRLSLNSIKGGAAMGQAVDNLFILERMKEQKNISKLTLEVARSKLCRPGHIFLQFDQETTRFGETEPEAAKPEEPVTFPESYNTRQYTGPAPTGIPRPIQTAFQKELDKRLGGPVRAFPEDH